MLGATMGIYTKAILRLILAFIVLYLLVFTLGGNPSWLQGWIYYGILIATVVSNLAVLSRDPALLEERMGPLFRPGQNRTDRIQLSVFLVFYTAWYVLMPLDAQRFHWSSDFPLWLNISGGLLMAGGSGLLAVCFAQNSYLSTVVRVQAERGHRVIDSGLYSVVRHPMYLGVLCFMLGGALLLGSVWGTLTAVLGTLTLYIRAISEEQLLCRELPGYADYVQRVRWRLIPGLF